MQLVSPNLSSDDVARLSSRRGWAIGRLDAQIERFVSQRTPLQQLSVAAANTVTSFVYFDASSSAVLPACQRPLFCSSTHAPGRSYCMCHWMHHC
jgi:hypothetical protein